METRQKKNDETASSGPNEKVRPDRRPPARAEVDDFEEEGAREHDSGRGGFVSEHSDANPGGTTGEHSGQRPPGKH